LQREYRKSPVSRLPNILVGRGMNHHFRHGITSIIPIVPGPCL
jgi:hypothetical protein